MGYKVITDWNESGRKYKFLWWINYWKKN
jgi:hypothetical protein